MARYQSRRKQIVVKLQTVRIIPMEFDLSGNGESIGNQIDRLLHDTEIVDGLVANKLVIDLDPPHDDNAKME